MDWEGGREVKELWTRGYLPFGGSVDCSLKSEKFQELEIISILLLHLLLAVQFGGCTWRTKQAPPWGAHTTRNTPEQQ